MLHVLASPSRLAAGLAAGLVLAIPLAAQGLCSGSLTLGGTGNYISIPDHPDLQPASAVTYECWFLTHNNNPGRLISKGDGLSCSTDRTFDLGVWNGMLNFGFFLQSPGGRTCFLYTGTPVQPNTWAHVAATFDSVRAEVALFVDGVQVDLQSTPAGSTLFQSTTPLYLGATPPYSNQYFQGQINQVRIWDFAWTANETAFRFVEVPFLPGTKAQWPLDGHLFDLAGGHHGQAVGTIGWVGDCATSTGYGRGTSGPFGVPTLTSGLPILGSTMTVQVDGRSGALALGVLALGTQPADLPVLGGTLLVDALVLHVVPIPSTGAALPVAIVNQATLIGMPIFAQLGVFYPSQTQLAFSAGLQWMVGT